MFFFKNFWRTQVLFVGPLISLFCTSGDVSSGLHKPEWAALFALGGGVRDIRSTDSNVNQFGYNEFSLKTIPFASFHSF